MPRLIPDNLRPPKERSSGRITRGWEISLITPLFGGGAEPGKTDEDFPIRGTSIRGQLQFWWRATRGARFADHRALFERHAEIWGTTERASPVEVVVSGVKAGSARPCAHYDWDQKARAGKGGWRLVWETPFASSPLPCALFPFQGEQPKSRDGDPGKPPASFIESASFTLKLRYAEELSQDVETAVWAWVNFGGLGARTRRGCGALLCKDAAPGDIRDLDHWFKDGSLDSGGVERAWPTLPRSALVGEQEQAPADAWKKVIGLLQSFRQGVEIGRSPGQRGRPGRSRYPEPETIRRVTGRRPPPACPAARRPRRRVSARRVRASHRFPFPGQGRTAGHCAPSGKRSPRRAHGKPSHPEAVGTCEREGRAAHHAVGGTTLNGRRAEAGSPCASPSRDDRRDGEAARRVPRLTARSLTIRIGGRGFPSLRTQQRLPRDHAMTCHLLALTVGPVQEFIAAARRTRDLWFGSHLLSEISKAVAKSLQDQGGKLVLPAPDADLEPGSLLSVANVVVAELEGGDPAAVADAAKEAAKRRWRDFADEVLDQNQGVIRADIWNGQVGDVIEFYAAWVPRTDDYKADRAALMRLLAARKRCRDCLPARGCAGVPKSSLDGLRESVLRPPGEWPERSRRRLHLQEGEQLDVVGLVKRVWRPGADNPSYPSVARIAADPWIRLLEANCIGLGPLIAVCRALGPDVVHEFEKAGPRGHPEYKAFPFEGPVLFRTRHPDLREEAGIASSDPGFVRLERALHVISAAARKKKLPPEPNPYLGVLVADGDRMGAALSNLNSPETHRDFSRALVGFAARAREVVRNHYGVLVYSGGDDVLAFVPVDHCLSCARELHDAFGDALAHWRTAQGPLTLSVGLAIAHFMEPLEDLLRYGRYAERHAKHPRSGDAGQTDRNGLAVHLVKRGGGPVAVRANWSTDAAQDLSHRLRQFAEWIAARSVPGRVPYDLRRLAALYDPWPAEHVKDAIQCDVLEVMRGKQPRGAGKMQEIRSQIRNRVGDARSLRLLADELLVARAISAASGMTAGASES